MPTNAPPTKRDGDRNMSNGNGNGRLAGILGAAAALCAALLLCGCSTIRDVVDEYRDWRDSQTNAPAVPPDVPPGAPDAPPATPGTPTQPDTPAADEADYSAFTWAYGGFNGSRAALSEPRIASLRMTGRCHPQGPHRRRNRGEAHRQAGCQAGQSSWQFAGTHRGAGEAAGGGGMKEFLIRVPHTWRARKG